MSTLVSDPNNLTKAQIKAEFVDRGFEPPPSDAKKDVYVQMYKNQFLLDDFALDEKKPTEPEKQLKFISRFESFSSDEEELGLTDVSHQKRKKKPVTQSTTMQHAPVKDVTDLTDEELFEALQSLGMEVGPILDSTRRVYQKKLQQMLAAEMNTEEPTEMNGSSENHDLNGSEEFSDEDDEDLEMEVQEEESPPIIKTQQSSITREQVTTVDREPIAAITQQAQVTRRKVVSLQAESRTAADSEQTTRKQVFRSETTATATSSSATTRTAASAEAATPARRGIAIWLQVVLLLIVAVIVFLIITNMEPASTSRHSLDG
ncbi:lamina-associated polypeptide 2, isoforms beta/delta/epsilon/gamma-like [Tubulanus polymorphus]|uniref:lamina-associated polypeptide 2, isoforms beta/delta/epsilon/gamma-like n=1 Tax=Tubulanus polymorphus TaxID=672921 RepID=UPI003DA2C2D6